jgi:hypothetical protein
VTVKELKAKLNQFHDSCIVMMPKVEGRMTQVSNVAKGVNELDGIVLIDDYTEDDEDEM